MAESPEGVKSFGGFDEECLVAANLRATVQLKVCHRRSCVPFGNEKIRKKPVFMS